MLEEEVLAFNIISSFWGWVGGGAGGGGGLWFVVVVVVVVVVPVVVMINKEMPTAQAENP